jgi:hypothetical protein
MMASTLRAGRRPPGTRRRTGHENGKPWASPVPPRWPTAQAPPLMVQNQRGASSDPKADVALAFASKLVKQRGHVSEADVQAVNVRAARATRSQHPRNTWSHR